MAATSKEPTPSLYIPRRVRITDEQSGATTDVPLADLRQHAAYVLLGDPGAGKTRAMDHEARHTPNGCYVRAVQIHQDIQLRADRVLFVDALDEARAGASDAFEPLKGLRQWLQDQGVRRLRISCREADWFGQVDRQAFASLLPAGELLIAHLLPMDEADLVPLIAEFGASDPERFIALAHEHRLDGLLFNPMSLQLLVKATRQGWPQTREALYRLACGELITEPNLHHKVRSSRHRPKFDALSNAAAELCALMLLSGKSAISLQDESVASDVLEFSALPVSSGADSTTQRATLVTRLFCNRPGLSATVEPVHRTVAEYLAAKHLSGRLDAGLSPRRLAALLGTDGRVATSLRGLNAWLASLNATHRHRFIQADPLGVALYGDASSYASHDKQRVFECLAAEASNTPHFRMGQWHQKPDAALASADLTGYFQSIISSNRRTPEHLALLELVFDVLTSARGLIELDDLVLAAVRDETMPLEARNAALDAWLASSPDVATARTLLSHLSAAQSPEGALIGRVLRHFHPAQMGLAEALRCLPPPSREDPDAWHFRWGRHVAKKTPDDALESSVEAWLNHGPRTDGNPMISSQDGSAEILLRLIQLNGDTATADQLCRWLSLGLNSSPTHILWEWRSRDPLKGIQAWLEKRPKKYKSTLATLIAKTPFDDDERASRYLRSLTTRLLDSPWPSDLGKWYLEHTRETPYPALIKHALMMAANCLVHHHSDDGLSLELMEAWRDAVAQRHPLVDEWFQQAFVADADTIEYHREDQQHRIERRRKFENARASWMARVEREALALNAGGGSISLLNELAMAWNGRFHDIQGDSGEQRLKLFLNNDPALFEAACAGLRRTHWRDDLPRVRDILALENLGQRHTAAETCLLGADLEVAQTPDAPLGWPVSVASRLLAFHLTRGTGDDPAWFEALIDARPDWVADVYATYVRGRLNAGQSYIFLAHRLTDDPALAPIAARVMLPILRAWPTRTTTDQRNTLLQLLDAAWAFVLPDDLTLLAKQRLARRSLDVAQRAFWQLVQTIQGKAAGSMQRLLKLISPSGLAQEAMLQLLNLPGTRTQTDRMPLAEQAVLWRCLASSAKPAHRRRDPITGWLHRLATEVSDAATAELQAWLADPALGDWHSMLRGLLYQQQAAARDARYAPAHVQDVAALLNRSSPANVADLQAIVLDMLDDLARDITGSDTRRWEDFWHTDPKTRQPIQPKIENDCRDKIKQFMTPLLHALRITLDKEASKVDDSRCDLQAAHRSEHGALSKVPIEIKRANHRDLWTAMRTQLMDRYAMDPASDGHGIYLVLWFGAKSEWLKAHPDRLPMHRPEDLQRHLVNTLPSQYRHRVSVVVLNVSSRHSAKPS